MDKFAFIIHPANIDDVERFEPGAKGRPLRLVRKIMEWMPPFKIGEVKGVKSKQGNQTEGWLICCPLLPRQLIRLGEDAIMDKIIGAGKIAQELGAKMVGLGGYTALVGDKGLTVAKELDVAVTTGNSYTVASVIEAIYQAAESMNADLGEATVSIIGASGSIGSACARILAGKVSRIVMNARDEQKLSQLAETLPESNTCQIEMEMEIQKAVSQADIVIVTTSSPGIIIDTSWLKPGAIVSDVAYPRNVPADASVQRPDILVIEGGMAKPLSEIEIIGDINHPEGVIYACMAETIILTLERKFEDYSLGDELSVEKINEISALAQKHGFDVSWQQGTLNDFKKQVRVQEAVSQELAREQRKT